MKIINGSVYTPEFQFEKKNIVIREGRILQVLDAPVQSVPAFCADSSAGQAGSAQAGPAGEKEERTVDASGCYVIPGLIDLHFHGCMGADICDGTKKALEAIPGVESAVADHTAGTAVVTLAAAVEDEALRAAVEAQDYKVLGIE